MNEIQRLQTDKSLNFEISSLKGWLDRNWTRDLKVIDINTFQIKYLNKVYDVIERNFKE